jgi:hypothetical protein
LIKKYSLKLNDIGKSIITVLCSPIRENIPSETDIETAKSTYKNGILEITFKKKEQTKGETIRIK